MKTLYLLRHAKSSWADVNLADFDRPLNDRGLDAAPFMGKFMADNILIPDTILTSPARRAEQTARLVKEAADISYSIKFDERIYEASPQMLNQVVSELDDDLSSAMLVGHNPGIEGFIRFLTGKLEPMPTAALAVIDLNIANWAEVSADKGAVRRIARPKDLLKARHNTN
jgi:phosphohistidine phosphatase